MLVGALSCRPESWQRGRLVPALFALLSRGRGVARRAGVHADHVTVWRVGPALRPGTEPATLKPTNDSWRVDETSIRVKGKWRYLDRAVDSSGATLDFLLSARQDAAAATRFLAKALGRQNHPVPRIINTDSHSAYPPAIVGLKAESALDKNCRHRPVQYLNNVLEQ